MNMNRTPIEIRILGVLLEKQMTTPDYYPLSLNALILGCNQKSNRNPVMDLSESEVLDGLQRLRNEHLVWQVRTAGSRVSKYEHNLKEIAEFSIQETAVLCELMLRGPQTLGELRIRCSRIFEFHGTSEVEHIIGKLMAPERGIFVKELPRRPGHKENRFAHLFTDVDPAEVFLPAVPGESADTHDTEPSGKLKDAAVREQTECVNDLEQRIRDLETMVDRISELEKRITVLEKGFVDFNRQFE
jgi:uncharacterized protein